MRSTASLIRAGILVVALATTVLGLAACTQQERAKQFGGTVEQTLAPGQKFVTISWEEDHLWIATRPMREGEQPEIITINESSSYGVFQGTIVLHERR